MGAPNAYINSGIVTTISGTDATYTNVNANNVYSPYIAGQTGGDPAGAGVLYVANAEVGSKLWLSGTAAGEGLRANVGIITYFGHNAKSVLGDLGSQATTCTSMQDRWSCSGKTIQIYSSLKVLHHLRLYLQLRLLT